MTTRIRRSGEPKCERTYQGCWMTLKVLFHRSRRAGRGSCTVQLSRRSAHPGHFESSRRRAAPRRVDFRREIVFHPISDGVFSQNISRTWFGAKIPLRVSVLGRTPRELPNFRSSKKLELSSMIIIVIVIVVVVVVVVILIVELT